MKNFLDLSDQSIIIFKKESVVYRSNLKAQNEILKHRIKEKGDEKLLCVYLKTMYYCLYSVVISACLLYRSLVCH